MPSPRIHLKHDGGQRPAARLEKRYSMDKGQRCQESPAAGFELCREAAEGTKGHNEPVKLLFSPRCTDETTEDDEGFGRWRCDEKRAIGVWGKRERNGMWAFFQPRRYFVVASARRRDSVPDCLFWTTKAPRAPYVLAGRCRWGRSVRVRRASGDRLRAPAARRRRARGRGGPPSDR